MVKRHAKKRAKFVVLGKIFLEFKTFPVVKTPRDITREPQLDYLFVFSSNFIFYHFFPRELFALQTCGTGRKAREKCVPLINEFILPHFPRRKRRKKWKEKNDTKEKKSFRKTLWLAAIKD